MKAVGLDALAEGAPLHDLEPADLAALLTKLSAAQLRLAATLAELAVEDRHRSNAATDRLLDVQQTAERLGVSPTWLYRHAARLPFGRRIGGHLRFDSAGLERWIASRPAGQSTGA